MNIDESAGELGHNENTPTPAPEQEKRDSFPIVGIGASAGGLAAFESFFSGLPKESEHKISYVLVQHLAPDHKSLLCEIIGRNVDMEVIEIEDGTVVKPNCVYVIPPARDLALLNGKLQLLTPLAPRGHRMPIDFFFRSLAQDQRELAIGIILSGNGNDGTLGLRAIKGEGGMVMVQQPSSTDFEGMPMAAISTGLVDFVLPANEMARRLIDYITHPRGKSSRNELKKIENGEASLQKIFVLLRTQSGHDFSLYKRSTIERRIERRMAVNHIDSIENYLRFVQRSTVEVDSLYQDLLIGVTSFFRDQDVFHELETNIIPKLFQSRTEGATVRIWCAGCSTGEEAYSIAILIEEYLTSNNKQFNIQVFATDINSHAIETARAGLYPASIEVDVSTERLARFFTFETEKSHYRIKKSIRDMLIFSEQDLIRDPPFSRIDLLSCRNLLIYFSAELQRKLIPLFHYAINPDGFLFLDISSGVGEFVELFSPIDRKTKIFLRKSDVIDSRKTLSLRMSHNEKYKFYRKEVESINNSFPKDTSLQSLAEQALLRLLSPAAALVNWQGDIFYLHGRTGMFLELAPGETGVNNVLTMAREGLRASLSATLNKAVGSNIDASCPDIKVKTNGHYVSVNVTVSPVATSPTATPISRLYLVVFKISSDEPTFSDSPVAGLLSDTTSDASNGDNAWNRQLERQIELLKEEVLSKDNYIQSAHEELESSNEELNASLEEMQSVNEELQSSNEELETSKEELQSVNEELATVNAELQVKLNDLSRANNDVNNLLSGSGIGTVFVDYQLRVLRYTPALLSIINFIPTDIGRPIVHIASNLLGYDQFLQDIQSVLDTLVHKEIEVQVKDGRWYTMRIQPYRTLENVIEGAVIAFIDISAKKKVEETLRKANDLARLAIVVRDANDAITVQELNGRVVAWNPGAEKLYGWTEAEALHLNLGERVPASLRGEELNKLRRLSLAEVLEPYSTQRLDRSGKLLNIMVIATALVNDSGHVYAIATTERLKG